eukprot:767368-Hanusia_phi.AAC.1
MGAKLTSGDHVRDRRIFHWKAVEMRFYPSVSEPLPSSSPSCLTPCCQEPRGQVQRGRGGAGRAADLHQSFAFTGSTNLRVRGEDLRWELLKEEQDQRQELMLMKRFSASLPSPPLLSSPLLSSPLLSSSCSHASCIAFTSVCEI